jgi:hypothetical protein
MAGPVFNLMGIENEANYCPVRRHRIWPAGIRNGTSG